MVAGWFLVRGIPWGASVLMEGFHKNGGARKIRAQTPNHANLSHNYGPWLYVSFGQVLQPNELWHTYDILMTSQFLKLKIKSLK